jgi:hypothetical protein
MQIQLWMAAVRNPYVKFKFDLLTGLLNHLIEKIDVTTLDTEGKSASSRFP